MNATRFDRIARAFAGRKLTRRQAMIQGGTSLAASTLAASGLAAASAQDATPEPATDAADHGPTMLFVQTYQSGTIAPVEGAADRYTLTLEAGSGQTVYFSDRPDRIVGASPTAAFLEGLGFPEDNPPNAALVVETAPGETDIAVVELFAPLYDPVSQGVTYEVEVLANWETSLELGFHEAPTDLAAMAPAFGAAQLFIDDCPDATMTCYTANFDGRNYVEHGTIDNAEHDGFCYRWGQMRCLPCTPWNQWGGDARTYWGRVCNARYAACEGQCAVTPICTSGFGC